MVRTSSRRFVPPLPTEAVILTCLDKDMIAPSLCHEDIEAQRFEKYGMIRQNLKNTLKLLKRMNVRFSYYGR